MLPDNYSEPKNEHSYNNNNNKKSPWKYVEENRKENISNYMQNTNTRKITRMCDVSFAAQIN